MKYCQNFVLLTESVLEHTGVLSNYFQRIFKDWTQLFFTLDILIKIMIIFSLCPGCSLCLIPGSAQFLLES